MEFENVTVSKMPAELVETIKRSANENTRNFSQEVIAILKEHLNAKT